MDPDIFCLSDHLPHPLHCHDRRVQFPAGCSGKPPQFRRYFPPGKIPSPCHHLQYHTFSHLPDGFLPVLPFQVLQATVPGMFLHGKAVVFWNRYSESVDMLPCPCLTPHGNLCIPEVRNIRGCLCNVRVSVIQIPPYRMVYESLLFHIS